MEAKARGRPAGTAASPAARHGEENLQPAATFFWRRLDHPGHDGCRLFRLADGWRLAGMAVFREAGRPCQFSYEVETDAAWLTRRAGVSGYLGRRAVDLRIAAAGHARWRVGGEPCDDVDGCLDVDLGFTPATNLIAVRRLALRVGQRAEASAAWLQLPALRFVRLEQTYRRVARAEYDYAAPAVGYAGRLRMAASGAVVRYPGLFERVASG